jgi:hypothetical protein
MPKWFEDSLGVEPGAGPDQLMWRFCLSFAMGYLVSVIYRATHQGGTSLPTFPRTLVLLTILIAMVTQVIGNNVARAFSLVGALSIVRFRTVVHDTSDTAFVIFAVVIGMAAGADHLWAALCGVVVVGAAAFLIRPKAAANQWSEASSTLHLRMALGHSPPKIIEGPFGKFVAYYQCCAVGTARQGSALDVTYLIRLRDGAAPDILVSELNKVEGVQDVELKLSKEDED